MGCPLPASTSTFLPGPAVSLPRPPSLTQLAPSKFILSSASRLSRELRSYSPPPVRRPEVPSLELRSLFATSTRRIVDDEPPGPPPIRPRCFSHPRRFDPPLVLQVYFAPQPRPGLTLQGIFPPSQPRCLSTTRCPLVVICSSLPAVAHQHHVPQTRPQGFDPRQSPLPVHRGLAAALARAPLELLLHQVFPLTHLKVPSHPPPLVTLKRHRRSRHLFRPSAFFGEPVWLASPEAAYLLEVCDLPRNRLAPIR